MTGIELARLAASIPPADTAAQDEIAARVVNETRAIPAAVLAAALAKRQPDSVNGMYLALQLEDFALGAVLERADACSASRRRQFLSWLVEGERRQRAMVLVRVEKLLGDRSPAGPAGEGRETHGQAPVGRVCDEAYLLARRLLTPPPADSSDGGPGVAGSPPAARTAADEAFLRLSPRERDAEIAQSRSSPGWVELRAVAGA